MFDEGARDPAPRSRYTGLADVALLLITAIIVRGPSFWNSIVDPDEIAFALAGREVAHGFLPYLAFFDIKPVGSTLMLAAALRLLGENLSAVRILGLGCVFASAVLIKLLAERLGARRAPALCAGLFYIAFSTTLHGLATMTEIMLAPFTLGCVLLLGIWFKSEPGRNRLGLIAAAGFCCGLAVLIKLVPIVPGGLALATLLIYSLWRRRLSFVQVVVAGLVFSIFSALPMIASALVFRATGHLPEFLYANFGFSKAYVTARPHLQFIVRDFIRILSDLWPLAALAGLAIADGIFDLISPARRMPLGTALCAWWVAGEFVAACAPMHFYHHYFLMMLPPLCILAVQGAAILYRRIGVAHDGAIVVLTAAMALVPVAPLLARTLPSMVSDKDISREAAAVIRRAAGHRKRTLLVTQQEFLDLYLLTGAPLPTPYVQPEQLMGTQTALLPVDARSEVRRVLATGPEFIVVNRDVEIESMVTAEVEPILARDYREIAHLTEAFTLDYGVTRHHELYIYQRSAPPPAAGRSP